MSCPMELHFEKPPIEQRQLQGIEFKIHLLELLYCINKPYDILYPI